MRRWCRESGLSRFNDVDDLKRQFDGSVCAICLETIQGEGGIRPLSPEFLQTARQLCDRTGALLILDEIQCGLGRTGKYFAYQHYGIKPDIVTVAKPLAAGLPLGALLTTDRVASGMHPGMHGTTFGGGPLACCGGHRIPARARSHAGAHPPDRRLLPRQTGRPQSQTRLACSEIRGMGLMLGMNLDSADRAKAVVAQLLERGILINRTQDTVLRFLPPYIIQQSSRGPGGPCPRLGPDFHPTEKALTSNAKSNKKEPITVSSQPFQTTQVATPPATTTFPGRDLISIRDLSPIEIETIFHLAGLLKARPANFRTALAGKQMVMFFEKQSLRTRLTFEAGMASLGGNAFFMDQTAGRLDAREKLSDIAHNVERWVDAIVLRTYAHGTVEGMAEHACVPVINALSDLEHPCQALADYFTLLERFGDLKKICLAYVGDGNNVAHSLLLTAATLGSQHSHRDARRATSADAQIVADARDIARQTGAVIEILNDPKQAVDGADAVYTDAWASMGHEHEEQERNQIFPPYQVNEKLVAGAAPHAVFMHCLPAHRGMEITDASHGLRSLRGLRSGGKPPARAEGHSVITAWRQGGPHEFEECQCLKKLFSHIPEGSTPPSSFPG